MNDHDGSHIILWMFSIATLIVLVMMALDNQQLHERVRALEAAELAERTHLYSTGDRLIHRPRRNCWDDRDGEEIQCLEGDRLETYRRVNP